MPSFVPPLSNTTYASRTNTTVPAPTDLVAGQFMLAAIAVGGATNPAAITPPDGWLLAPGAWPREINVSGVFYLDCYLYYKWAGSSEPADYTWVHGAQSTQGVIARYSDVEVSTPFDVTPTINSGTGATVTWTGLTPATANTLLVAIEWDFADNTTNTTPPTGTAPTFTERLDITLTYICDGVYATTTPTGNKTHTSNSTGVAPWASTLVALRHSSGGVARTQQVDDAITGTDELARDVGRALADTGSLADNVSSSGASAHTRQFDDAIAGTDAISKAPGKTLAETAEVTDSGMAVDAAYELADGASVTDQTTAAAAFTRALADAGTVTDNVHTGGSTAHQRQVDDAIAGTDAQSRDITRALGDTVAAGDAAAPAAGFTVALDDAAELGDQTTPAAGFARAIADTGQLSDAVNSGGSTAHTRQIADAISGTDAQSRDIARTIADAGAVADQLAAGFARALDDAVAVTDGQSRAWNAARSIDDAAAIGDTVSDGTTTAHSHVIADGLVAADEIAPAAEIFRSIDDALAIADQPARGWNAVRELSDAFRIAETIDGVGELHVVTLAEIKPGRAIGGAPGRARRGGVVLR